MNSLLLAGVLFLAILGIADSSFLAIEHFRGTMQDCVAGVFSDCGKVLSSDYAVILGIPLAVIGVVQYSLLATAAVWMLLTNSRFAKYYVLVATKIGLLASICFVYLQLFVIQAICFYCMGSAILSLLLFTLAQIALRKERKVLMVRLSSWLYVHLVKKILFLIPADTIHELVVNLGEILGKIPAVKSSSLFAYVVQDTTLNQEISGITFANPVGLAAGFDYEGKLTQILPSLGFGYQTVGTVTNLSYAGNLKPRLGRLPKSKSLMVNKGFKSSGAENIIRRLEKLQFIIPVGISIGRSNSPQLQTQQDSIADIIQSFKLFENSELKHAYYELNISCPNLVGDITFYPPQNLEELLVEVDKLSLSRPVFIKMPIIKTDQETLDMLKVVARHSISGVIIGNLLGDRSNPAFVQAEVKQFERGNFSGKPTFARSNELIKLAFQHYRDRLVIIGCGGIFNGQDAYAKIKSGASLVQLITGLVFEGPQLAVQINLELRELLKQDGYTHVSQAVGVDT